ncbi:DUF4870 domain-containing protein [Microbacterium paludicola]|uniref:DUF4870 domain-containing protein n=1 Tax=Microbacterium paludicola TaxID=300019 RepID=UPI0011A7A6E4|nr:DUF4870 domain-containing protein [Microbacterium paludicola]
MSTQTPYPAAPQAYAQHPAVGTHALPPRLSGGAETRGGHALPQHPAPHPMQGRAAQSPQPPYGSSATTPTGTLSWALGFFVLVPLPFLNGTIAGAAMALSYGASAKRGALAKENGRHAANWGLTYFFLSWALFLAYFFRSIWAVPGDDASGLLSAAAPFGLAVVLALTHIVIVIIGTVRSYGGRVMRVPFAIPFVRA